MLAVAVAQLIESISRLMRAAAELTDEDIEWLTLAVDRLAYDAEHRATYNQHID